MGPIAVFDSGVGGLSVLRELVARFGIRAAELTSPGAVAGGLVTAEVVGTDPASEMGPLITRQALERVNGYVANAPAEGATVVGRNPSTAEVLAAVRSTGAGSVVLLPNDTNTHAVAIAAAREAAAAGFRVSVVPTRGTTTAPPNDAWTR